MSPRPLRPHAIGLAAGFLVAAIAWGGLFAAQFGKPTWNSRWATSLYEQKVAMAERPGPPRLLVVGGSSALFSVRARDLGAELGVPAINFGTHAGLDLEYILERADTVARPGDVVVLAIEYEYYRRDPAWMNEFMLDHAVARDPAYFHRLPLHRKVGAILQMDVVRATGPWRERGDPRRPGPFEPYGTAVLNEHGDMLANNPVLKTDATRERLRTMRRLRVGTDPDAFALLAAFVRAWLDRGVHVVATPPGLMRERIHDTAHFRRTLSTIESWHRDIGLDFIVPPRDAIYPPSWFFDTRYHTDGSAARFHTARLVEPLRRHVAAAKKAPVPPLPAPQHPLAQLDAAFSGWEPSSGFGRVEGPYPQWGLGAVIWALGDRSSLAVRAIAPGQVQVRGSFRAAAAGQRLEVHLAGRKLYEKVFAQASAFEDIAFTFEAGAGDAQLQLAHSGNPRPDTGPHYAILVRSLRFDQPGS